MKKIGEFPLQWAEEFSVDRYEGGYDVVRVSDGRTYFVIPENGSVPDRIRSRRTGPFLRNLCRTSMWCLLLPWMFF